MMNKQLATLAKTSIFIPAMIAFFSLIFGEAVAQGTGISLPANHLLPVVMSPSPTAASLGKYGEWPVNYYTGTPNISIPIYEIRSGNLSLPISLNYHAGGIKVEDVSSWVGTGWDLNAGGVITRTMVGMPDEYSSGFGWNYYNHVNQIKPSYNVNTQSGWGFINSFANSIYDSEPDVYYFNFAGHSGRFFFDTLGTFHAIPENALQVVKSPFPIGQYNHWEIRDEYGTTYVFGPMDDNTTTEAGKEYSWTTGTSSDLGDVRSATPTAWYLTSIISKEGTDTISLQYAYKLESVPNPRSQSYGIISNFQDVNSWATANQASMSLIQLPYYHTVLSQPTARTHRGNVTLSGISWRGGSVQLTAGLNRQDLVWAGNTYGTMLTNIQIRPMNGQSIKNYNLIYAYTNNRYYLDTVRLNDMAGNKIYDYSLDYYPALPDRTSYAQDHWGYYNGATSNIDLLVTTPSLVNGSPSYQAHSNRAANGNMVYGSLSQISYPTGGRTQFEYEPNQCAGSSIPSLDPGVVISANTIGGLRIKSIKNFSDAGCTLVSTRIFQYSPGTLLTAPSYNHYMEQNIQSYATCQNPPCLNSCYYFARLLEVTSTSQNILGFTQGAPVGYTTVTERSLDLNSTDNGYTQYNYSYTPDVANSPNMNISYWQPANVNALIAAYPADVYDYQRGLLLSELTYARGAAGSYFPVRTVQNAYNTNNLFYQLKALRAKQLRFGGYVCAQFNSNGVTTNVDDYTKDYAYSYYNITTSWVQKTSTTTVVYDQNGQNPMTTQVNYTYNNTSNLLPTNTTTTDSKGNTLSTAIQYASDLAAPAGSPANIYNTMVARHMVGQPISQIKSVNGAQMEVMTTNYGLAGPSNNLILPSSIQTQQQTNPVETRVNFFAYDKYGNILEQSKANDVHEVYLYGYRSQYPVARILGSTYAAASAIVSQAQLDSAHNSTDYQMRTTLNGIRTGLSGALVNTYTYAPLLGMTGEVDPAARLSTYQYDNAWRLKSIRDKDSNIVKSFDYYYAASKGACTGSNYYFNDAASGTYTRNNCGSGYDAGSATYVVPKGRYSSGLSLPDANAKANQDILANGQNYANTYGSCTVTPPPPPPQITMSCNNIGGFGPYTEVYTNTSTGQQYTFTVTAAGGVLGYIPQGTYNLTITAAPNLASNIFQAGCNGLTLRGTTATFTNLNVTSSSCNQTIIDVN